MASVALSAVTKSFDGTIKAVADLSLSVDDGELLVLVGPSGCGKSTALRMVAGLETPTAGDVYIGEECVTFVSPRERDVAMVFQNYALYPHMDIRKNLGFGLKIKRTPKHIINERVTRTAQMLELTEHLDKRPGELSGGQRQRVAMGRAIVREPQVFLMDEPLSNLDAKLRATMRAEIVALQSELRTTMVHVTHDQVEALTMGHRVAVLQRGSLQQLAPPNELFDTPANVFVASFIGTPSMNLFEGRVADRDDGSRQIEFGSQRMTYDIEELRGTTLEHCSEGAVTVGIRPHHVELRPDTQSRATVSLIESLGTELLVHASFDAPPHRFDADIDTSGGNGSESRGLDAQLVVRLEATSVRPLVGESFAVHFPAGRLHLFDALTGARLP